MQFTNDTPGKRILSRLLKMLPPPLELSLLNLFREIVLACKVRKSRKVLGDLRRMSHLKVNLGCGADLKPGFVNIDADAPDAVLSDPSGHPIPHFVVHDLRRGLPLGAETCDLVYSCHFLEHLEAEDAIVLLKDCHRALARGGLLRLALPKFREMFQAYLYKDAAYFEVVDRLYPCWYVPEEIRCWVDYVNLGVYDRGAHKWAIDAEKIILILKWIGFRSVTETGFSKDLDPDTELRRPYTFYVEARK